MSTALDRALAALAEPNRRRIVELLRERPYRAGNLAAAARLSPPALSRHLRVLRRCGLVEETHPDFDARVRVYQLKPEPMEPVLRWLEDSVRLASAQAGAFNTPVDRD